MSSALGLPSPSLSLSSVPSSSAVALPPSSSSLPSFGLPPSPLLTSIQTILTEYQKLHTEAAASSLHQQHLVSRIALLEAAEREREREVADLKRKVAILEYGVRHERAMRMEAIGRMRRQEGSGGSRRVLEELQQQGEERKRGQAEAGDEKEQLLLKAKAAPTARKKGSKAAHLVPHHYFTLPSRLPASPLSADSLLHWRDYFRDEGGNTNIQLTQHTDREQRMHTVTSMQTAASQPETARAASPPPAAAAPASPAPAASPVAAGSARVSSILNAGKKNLTAARKKKLQFADVDEAQAGKEQEEEAEGSKGKSRKPKLTASVFTSPPSAAKATSTAASSAAASPAVSASPAPSTATLTSSAFKTLKPKLSLRHHVAAVRAVAFDCSAGPAASSSHSSSAHTVLASASEDHTVQLWSVPSSALSSASASVSSLVRKVTAAKVIEPSATFRHLSPVLSVALHLRSGVCVAGTSGGEVEVWDVSAAMAEGKSSLYADVAVYQSGRRGGWKLPKPVWSLLMDEAGALLVCACADGAVYVCKAAEPGAAPLHVVKAAAPAAVPTSLSFLSSSQLLCGYTDGGLSVIDLQTGSVASQLSTPSHVSCVASASSSSSPTVLSGHVDGQILLHDTRAASLSSPPAHSLQAHSDVVTSLSCHPQDSRVASSGHDAMIRLWDGRRCLQMLEPHQTHRPVFDEAVHCVRWSGGGHLASAGADSVVRVFA